MPAPREKETKETVSTTPFFILWSGQAISLLGSQVVQFALIWWITIESGSAIGLAIASLLGLVPQIVFGPFIGAIVDRSSRKYVMFAADSVTALASSVLLALFYLDSASLSTVYVILFVRAIGSAFHRPAMTASTSLMIPHEHLTRIQGLNQALSGGLMIISAPLGALALGLWPMHVVISIDVITAIFAILPLLFVFIPQPKPSQMTTDIKDSRPSLWQEFLTGLRYVRDLPGLPYLVAMSAIINLAVFPAFSLLPLMVTEVFGTEPLLLGWLSSANGIGIFMGGIIISVWGGFKRRIYTSLAGLLVLGVGLIIFGLIPSGLTAMAIGVMFVIGAMIPMISGPMRAVMQTSVAAEIQGRVFSLLGSLESASIPISLLVSGAVAEMLGVQALYVIGGLVTFVVGVLAFFIPAVVHFEDGRRDI